MNYEVKQFNLPALADISAKSIEEHLGLYAGYVKNFNAISDAIVEAANDSEKNAHVLSELMRRRAFEFDGMRLHEYYFAQFEGGATPLAPDSAFAQLCVKEYRDPEFFSHLVKNIGLMRGPGWAIVYWDPEAKQPLTAFVGEQHQGHFATLPMLLALDVWEHAYLLDYGAQGKGKYIDAFFKNLNWGVVEKRFAALSA